MIKIEIPGYNRMTIKHLVLDYNGTLAVDGSLISGVGEMLNALAADLDVHVVTADTFGKAKENLSNVNCTLQILKSDDHTREKAELVRTLGKDTVVAIGNGRNDSLMLKEAMIGITVVQDEGAAVWSLTNSDIVCKSIFDALQLLINNKRIVATLRK